MQFVKVSTRWKQIPLVSSNSSFVSNIGLSKVLMERYCYAKNILAMTLKIETEFTLISVMTCAFILYNYTPLVCS